MIDASVDVWDIDKSVQQRIDGLEILDHTFCNNECFMVLERLLDLRVSISQQFRDLEESIGSNPTVETHLRNGGILDYLIELQIDNLVALVPNMREIDLIEKLAAVAKRVPNSDLTIIISKKVGLLLATDCKSVVSHHNINNHDQHDLQKTATNRRLVGR